MRGVMLRPSYAVPFLNPGRLVRVQSETGGDWGWGVLVSFHKRRPQDKPLAGPAAAAADGGGGYVIDVLLPCAPAARVTTATGQQITVGPPGGEGFKPPVDGGGKPEIQVRTAASGADCGVGVADYGHRRCVLRRRMYYIGGVLRCGLRRGLTLETRGAGGDFGGQPVTRPRG